ncbi:MAG: hypothetical protein N3F10_03990 [Candidatus Bathyarchaeota archaeon]|nr:hypothetical protein [Candidatus Bathyarchaeota archaeon]MCX8177441.1 hypothetical protein [Candidatus Bathyarchaeota archaeon]MDW8194108.1 hypothetical protein [Nitrososphaerota archaeon]
MRLATLIIGELILLGASILVFRSVWILLDEYFGNSYLTLMLVLGIILAVIGLMLVNYEVKCGLQKAHKIH